ncbi:hypothetical protein CBS101457_005973 [Exobasidium rhododendri]|nr:hypothetical protein CBS101457_005973 [Exobasidium rhododendri]
MQPPKADVNSATPEAQEKAEGRKVNITSLSSILGDRAQMERDRLERQKKRRREANIPAEEDEEEEKRQRLTLKSTKLSTNPAERIHRTTSLPQKAPEAVPKKRSAFPPLYWSGAIKKSFNQFSPHIPGTRFSEFLLPTTPFQANGLTHAVIATYCADIQWIACLFPKGPLSKSPEITFICLEERDLKAIWAVHCISSTKAQSFTEFLLLFYEDRLRLMILSGNMMEYDWKTIENTAFIHDFPKLPPGQNDMTNEYGEQMRAVLRSLSVPMGHPAVKMVSRYDLHSDCEARIVASIPTLKPLYGWSEIEKVGLGRLNKIVKSVMGRKGRGSCTVEAQGSSMGTYSTRWLQQFHLISSGVEVKDLLPLPSGAKANKVWAKAVSRKDTEKWPPIKLLFPSDRWVKTQSVQGPDGAGTFFGKSRQSVEKGFIDLLFQPVSIRGNIMMHHKAIIALWPEVEKSGEDVIGWAYMGSHNLTQAAWGNISQAKAGAEPQCGIGNWELGVVMPLRRSDLRESQRLEESEQMAANIITWQRPVEKYRPDDIPWVRLQRDE